MPNYSIPESILYPTENRQELEALGFAWKPLHARAEARFEKGLAQLQVFHRRHGHTRVTGSYKKQPDLWKFRHYQRQLFRQGLLPPERKARLDELGFDWEKDAPVPRATVEFTDPGWHSMLKKLTAFQRKCGHTRVPKGWKDALLQRWVFRQRRRLRLGTLLPERAAALKALGFEAHTKGLFEDTLWERRFRELAAFHKQHGHTRVPRPRGQDVPLHSWRIHQRKLRRLGRLAPDRIAKLDTLGFDWG